MKKIDLRRECRPVPVGVVVAKTNDFVTGPLLEGALAALKRQGFEDVTVVEVAGSFELVPVARRLFDRGCQGVVLLGALIRGETSHYDFLMQALAAGCGELAAAGRLVACGVLTTDTVEQASSRAGGAQGNKGEEAALALVELLAAAERL